MNLLGLAACLAWPVLPFGRGWFRLARDDDRWMTTTWTAPGGMWKSEACPRADRVTGPD